MAAAADEPAGLGLAHASAPPAAQWLGPPTRQDGGRTYYAACQTGQGIQLQLGDDVYLVAEEAGQAPRIGRLESLHEEAAGNGSAGGAEQFASVRCFHRPEEVQLPPGSGAYASEVFLGDRYATVPLSSVLGTCQVVTPAAAERRPGSTVDEPGPDTYICARKWLPEEGLVVPVEQAEGLQNLSAVLQQKSFEEEGGQLVQPGPTAADTAAAQQQEQQQEKEEAAAAAAAEAAAGDAGTGEGGRPLSADLGNPLAQHPPPKRRRHEREAAPAEGGPTPAPGARRSSRPSSAASAERPGSAAGGRAGEGAGGSGVRAGTKRDVHGRWSRERYDGATGKLVAALRSLGATSADSAVLRGVAREEARRGVGDTGLLDHLLSHLVDQEVGEQGERFRRCHDAGGKMMYFLEGPPAGGPQPGAHQEPAAAAPAQPDPGSDGRGAAAAAGGAATRALVLPLPPPGTVDGGEPSQVAALAARCGALEQQLAVQAEEGRGRHEALAAALTASRSEVFALKRGMAALAGAFADQPALRAALEEAAGGPAEARPAGGGGEGAHKPGRAAAAAQQQQRQVPPTPANAGAERQGLHSAVASPPADDAHQAAD